MMNRTLIALAGSLTFVCGCTPLPMDSSSGSKPAPNPPGDIVPASNSAERLQRKTGEAWEAAEEFAAKSKDEFVAETKRRLAIMDQQLADWKNRKSTLSPEAQAKWDETRVQLEQRRSDLQKQLDKLGNSSSAAWQDLQAGASKAWKETAEAFRKAATHFE